jgi:hypothetical protein
MSLLDAAINALLLMWLLHFINNYIIIIIIIIIIRDQRTKEHPRTPDCQRKQSKRAWDGLLKIWRRSLHKYDPAHDPTQDEDVDMTDCLLIFMLHLVLIPLISFHTAVGLEDPLLEYEISYD